MNAKDMQATIDEQRRLLEIANNRIAELETSLKTANAAVQRLAAPVSVDMGARELATYLYERTPGLRVSEFLGGPTLTQPVETTTGERGSMLMSLTCPDGRVYGVEVYKVGK